MQVMAFYREIVESEERRTLHIRIPFLIHKRLLIMWTSPPTRRILERLSQSAGPFPIDTQGYAVLGWGGSLLGFRRGSA